MTASQAADLRNAQPLLELSHVTTVLNTARGAVTPLHDLSLTIRQGEVIAIVDHTKWGRAAFATFCATDQVSIVLTDEDAPEAMIEEPVMDKCLNSLFRN